MGGGGRGGGDTPNNYPQSAKGEASKVLEQGLVQHKFSVGKPRVVGCISKH